jgi:Spy/CpxP family protein refolding chaperone
MSFVRNALVALAVAAAIPAAASAQGPNGQGPEAGQRRGGAMQQQMLMKDITLSADQEAQMEKIRTATMEEMNALRGQPGTPLDSATRA